MVKMWNRHSVDIKMCRSSSKLKRMAHLFPLSNLPTFNRNGAVTVLFLDHMQNVRRAIARKIHEILSYLAKTQACEPLVSVVTLLTAIAIIIAISREHLMDATKLLRATGNILPHLPWPSTLLDSITEGKLKQHVAVTKSSSKILAAIKLSVLMSFILTITCTGHGGPAWSLARLFKRLPTPKGPRGWPVLGSWKLMQGSTMHRELAKLAWTGGASTRKLMAVSVGTTRIALTSDPAVAKELLRNPVFGDRPLKQAAFVQGFDRAIGFAPQGPYWRHLRKIAATHMFSHQQIVRSYESLQRETSRMIAAIAGNNNNFRAAPSPLCLRPFLQRAAVNNVMRVAFGRSFDFHGACPEAEEVEAMVREGFELLGGFNCADHVPLLRYLPFLSVGRRCRALKRRVTAFVQPLLDERRRRRRSGETVSGDCFVDVLLALEGDQKLTDDDMIDVLWKMVFRGTDTIAVLTEWAMAEVLSNSNIQAQIHKELDNIVGRNKIVQHKDIERLPYLQAVLKETLRSHPPGPLLSWARIAQEDINLAGYIVPCGTIGMVNMWAITHDTTVWPNPNVFDPARFLENDLDVLGTDLRLAPFGSGTRICPGRTLGMATTQLWLARLLQSFSWSPCSCHIDLIDNLKLSCEMASPLYACASSRIPL